MNDDPELIHEIFSQFNETNNIIFYAWSNDIFNDLWVSNKRPGWVKPKLLGSSAKDNAVFSGEFLDT